MPQKDSEPRAKKQQEVTTEPEFVTVEEAAEIIKRRPEVLEKEVKNGHLPAYEFGDDKAVRIRMEDLKEYIEKHKRPERRFLSAGEAAKVLNCSKELIYKEINTGNLRAFEFGPKRSLLRLLEDDLNAYIARRVRKRQKKTRTKKNA